MDTEAYRHVLEPQPLDYTEWKTGELRERLGGLLVRAEFANQRQYPEVEREINVATFELSSRREDYARFHQVGKLLLGFSD